jgi:hypothetical protein
MLADGLGTSADETVAEFMIFFALGFGFAGVRAIRGKALSGKPRWIGPALVALAVVMLAGAFTLPQRYLRPRVAKVRPRTAAQLQIVAPVEDAVVSRTLRLTFRLEGARLIAGATTRLRPDEGHLHVQIDGELIGMTYGLSQDLDVSGLDPGSHLLRAEFVAGDHAPFSPRVIRSVRFVVRR